MKIVMISFEFFPENVGVGIAATNLAKSFKKFNHDITVICPKKEKSQEKISKIEEIIVYRIGMERKTKIPIIGQIRSFMFIFQAKKIIKKINPDVILGEGWNHQSGVVSAYAGNKLKKTSVMRIHATMDAYFNMYKGFRLWLYNKAFSNNDIILATGKKMKEDIEKKIHRNVKILPNCYFNFEPVEETLKNTIKNRFIKEKKITSNFLNILAVGRFEEVKGFSYLISAMKELPECHLYLIGKGSLEQKFKSYTKENNIKNVTFVGFIPNEEVKNYMLACDIFIQTSIFEGLSMSLIEAMHSEMPIIATKTNGTLDLIINYENGIFIQSKSKTDIVDKIIELKNDFELKNKLAKNAYKTLVNNFSPGVIIKKFEEIIYDYKKTKK